MHHLEFKTERSPESLIPSANLNNNNTVNHPNADRLEQQLAQMHPSKRAAYLETAYVRAMKDLPDNNANNYIPAVQLAGIIDRWMSDSLGKYRKIQYLKSAATRADEKWENKKPSSIIAEERRQLKALFTVQKADFF